MHGDGVIYDNINSGGRNTAKSTLLPEVSYGNDAKFQNKPKSNKITLRNNVSSLQFSNELITPSP